MPSLGLNAAPALVTNPLGIRADPYQGCNFLVEIEGMFAGGFSECSGLQVETEMTDYREGGLNGYVHRFAGPTKYPPLVLKHGLSPDRRAVELAPGRGERDRSHAAAERSISSTRCAFR